MDSGDPSGADVGHSTYYVQKNSQTLSHRLRINSQTPFGEAEERLYWGGWGEAACPGLRITLIPELFPAAFEWILRFHGEADVGHSTD